jgi:hypothetical protein
MRQHLAEEHGFTQSDFGLFGDEPLSSQMLEGAHEQEHEYNPAVSHSHGNPRPDLFNDRRQEGRRTRPS